MYKKISLYCSYLNIPASSQVGIAIALDAHRRLDYFLVNIAWLLVKALDFQNL